jgi:hypothetical protein
MNGLHEEKGTASDTNDNEDKTDQEGESGHDVNDDRHI